METIFFPALLTVFSRFDVIVHSLRARWENRTPLIEDINQKSRKSIYQQQ